MGPKTIYSETDNETNITTSVYRYYGNGEAPEVMIVESVLRHHEGGEYMQRTLLERKVFLGDNAPGEPKAIRVAIVQHDDITSKRREE